ncbi:hypothetical protein CLV29_2524 [Naumannella halotolerans]|uniref:HNH endonuclease n=1 Tax=Naumannella halotolerans TaxID=993414 RepID=A0A4R7J1T0_9ACTN|nr:hypothetical protein CLV29_2524 [Naumannella halotolerans]
MPTRAPTRCSTHRQLNCPHCTKPWARKPKTWTGGSTRAWRKVRAQRLTIEPLCRQCGQPATQVDHIDGTNYATQRYDINMTRSLCEPCHRTRTAHQGRNSQG